MKQIIVSGGGGFGRNNDPHTLEAYILAQTKKQNLSVCFLPQASNENPTYVVRFLETFNALGAQTSWVSLFGMVDRTSIEKKLRDADVIYVGGGNTKSMLALWREWGIDVLLREAYERGAVMCGVSAGMICWFEAGITDSVLPLGVVQALGFLNGSCCPHFDTEVERKPAYLAKTKNSEISSGIALDDNVAAHYIDGKLHTIVTTKQGKKAFFVHDGTLKELAMTYLGDIQPSLEHIQPTSKDLQQSI